MKKKTLFGDSIRIKVFDEYNTPIANNTSKNEEELEAFYKKLKAKLR